MALMTPGDGVISACLDLLYNLPIVNRLAYKLLLNSGFAFFRICAGKERKIHMLNISICLTSAYAKSIHMLNICLY